MILVFGEILFDIFPEGRRIGGAPFNFACHLRQLGFDVTFVSRVGRDRLGQEILDFADGRGMDTTHIQVDDTRQTGSVQVTMNPDGTHTFSILEDRAYDYLEWCPDLEALCRRPLDLVYFGTLIQRTPRGQQFMAQAFHTLGSFPLRFCDINLRPLCYTQQTIHTCLDHCDTLKLSMEELSVLVPDDTLPPEKRAESLIRPGGPSRVIVTCGEKGAFWVAPTGPVTGPAPPKDLEIADTVGAGDAYAAMAAAGQLAGLARFDTMALAQEFAGRICQIKGALPKTADLYNTYRKRLFHDP